jgi:hypothetical protein
MKTTVEFEAVDIRTMHEMSHEEYRSYLDEMFYVDHHDVLRSLHAGYPIAATISQLRNLISYLEELESKIKPD